MRSLERFVEQEIIYCVTSLVEFLFTLEKYPYELDYIMFKCTPLSKLSINELENDLDEDELELGYKEEDIYEYWLVTDYLYELLSAKKEAVCEVFDLYIWGRTCSGQSISCDHVIQEIYNETHQEYKKGMQD